MASESYDFIIIGGGTAGLVVASRLSEDPNQSVLVLEAGLDHGDDPRVKIPGFYPILLGSELDYDFKTEPQRHLNGRSIKLPQGKVLGGSSCINAHVFVPPTKSLIDSWETLGNPGWNWDNLAPYFHKAYTSPSVDSPDVNALGIEDWKERSLSTGPIHTSFAGDWSHPLRKAWAETFKTRDSRMTMDPFLGASTGAFSCLATIHPESKERSNANSAYCSPFKGRRNLQVFTGVIVEKILFENEDGVSRAVGVQYTNNKKTIQVFCGKEVILAAGAIQSPKILELSGIGDATLLGHHGIKLVEDLPSVGENLHDHLLASIGYEAVDELSTLDDLVRNEPVAINQAMQEYTATQTGLLTSIGVDAYAYLPVLDCVSAEEQITLKSLFAKHRPTPGTDLQQARALSYYEIAERSLLEKQPSGAYLSILAQHILPVNPNSDSPQGAGPGKFLSIGLLLAEPLSRGSVHIQSPHVTSPPIIDPNYFSHPLDAEVMAQHMRFMDILVTSPPLSNLVKQPLRRRDPASSCNGVAEAKEYLKTSAISMWHMAGTCAMLPRHKGGVVDSNLEVYGVKNLRVVDSSAIPLTSTANLQATVYAFAERAAALIKADYGSE